MLLIKLSLVPLFILLLSLASKRWGSFIAGSLSGLPIIAAPITVFIYLEQGETFAIASAHSTLLGIISLGLFCFSYCWAATTLNWIISLLISLLVYFAGAYFIATLFMEPTIALFLVLVSILIFRNTLPRVTTKESTVEVSLSQTLARMIAAAILVVTLTWLANIIGTQLTGVLTVFPLAASILAVFTHINYSKESVNFMLSGIIVGITSLATFYYSLLKVSELLSFSASICVSIIVAVCTQCAILYLSNMFNTKRMH
ncbi:MAG: hypothetical protein GJ680_16990 [Alteromonadaceae bacterium]|nr:hypothetical protein [Alteromonadaceae bacterium]